MAKKAPNPIDKHVGSRVRMRRMMLGMSQEKLGDAIGLTFQQVQKYEKGSNRIGASRLQQIALILQVPVSFFFEGAPPPPIQATGLSVPLDPDLTTGLLSTSEGLVLARAFMRIRNVRLRRRIVELVEEMAADAASQETPQGASQEASQGASQEASKEASKEASRHERHPGDDERG